MTDEQDYRPKHVLDNIADMVKPEILADLEAARRDVMGMHEIELAVSDVPEKQLCDETGKTLFSRYMNILSDASCYKSACATCVSCKKPKAPVQPKREATAAAAKRARLAVSTALAAARPKVQWQKLFSGSVRLRCK